MQRCFCSMTAVCRWAGWENSGWYTWASNKTSITVLNLFYFLWLGNPRTSINYSLFPKGHWKQDKTLRASSPQCQSPSVHLAVTACNLWLRKYQALIVFLSKLSEGDSALASLTVLPCLLRNPGVFPPSAEGHHWVRRAEDRRVPEPQRSGQCHSLLPPYRAGFGKAKTPRTNRSYLKLPAQESKWKWVLQQKSLGNVTFQLLVCSGSLWGCVIGVCGHVHGDGVPWCLVTGIWVCWRRIWILEDLDSILAPKTTPCSYFSEINPTGAYF